MTPLITALVLMSLVVVTLAAAAMRWQRARTAPGIHRTPDGRPVLRLLQGGGELSGQPRHPAGLGRRPELVWSAAQREQALLARARAARLHPVSGTGTDNPNPRRPTHS